MIPNKSNFKFQELTPITGVKPYVIRFWETEFEEIEPMNSDSGQKLYSRKDVEAILKIKKLLFEEKMTIQEAKIAIKNREIEIQESETISTDSLRATNEKVMANEVLLSSLNLIRNIKQKWNW